jgi:hypothetical protein
MKRELKYQWGGDDLFKQAGERGHDEDEHAREAHALS